MKQNLSIADAYYRFQDIVHFLISLRKIISEDDQIRKTLTLFEVGSNTLKKLFFITSFDNTLFYNVIICFCLFYLD